MPPSGHQNTRKTSPFNTFAEHLQEYFPGTSPHEKIGKENARQSNRISYNYSVKSPSAAYPLDYSTPEISLPKKDSQPLLLPLQKMSQKQILCVNNERISEILGISPWTAGSHFTPEDTIIWTFNYN